MADATSLLADYLGILPRTSEETVLRLLIETGARAVGADEGSLLALDEEAGELCFLMTLGSEASEDALEGQRVPLGKGITGLAASTLEVQIGAPTFKDIKQTEARSGDSGPEAVMAAPMLLNDQLLGVITAVSFTDGKRFTSKDAELYARFAAIAALVVDQNRRLAATPGAPKSMGASGRLEQEIMGRLTRIITARPDALEHLAAVLKAFEALAAGGMGDDLGKGLVP